MIRLLGLLAVLAGSGAFGLVMAQRYAVRPRQLRSFHQAVWALETEISYSSTPLPEALASAVNGIEAPTDKFFLAVSGQITQGIPAGAAWQQAGEELSREFCLTAEDWRTILNIGIGLGSTDRIEEKKKLRLGCARLLAAEELAEEQSRKLARMWRYMGFLAGAAIVLAIL